MSSTEEMKKVERTFCSIEEWCHMSGMGRRWVYDAIGRGVLRAVKCGSRTLVDVPHGLAYMRSLPAANIKPLKREKAIA